MNLADKMPDAATLHRYVEILDFDQPPTKLQPTKKANFPTAKEIASHGNFTRTQFPKLSDNQYLCLFFDEDNVLLKTYIAEFNAKDSGEKKAEKTAKIINKLFNLSRIPRRVALARFDNNATIPTSFDIELVTSFGIGIRIFGMILEEFVLFNDYQYFSSFNWARQTKIENPFGMFH